MRFEVVLTNGNFGLEGRNNHIYITDLIPHLPADVFGGSNSKSAAPKSMILEYDGRRCETDVPSDQRTGKPRPFFRARAFVANFFAHTRAKPGDTVILDLVSAYHIELSIK
ncbi:hypothetical protein GFL92_36415 [Rhizobium leguminosarum bv. viciae]|nr:hypothetical protein [Rhizobium leguminosarum bv. viciae]TCB53311.1 hypothetical protein E0J20_21405 [Rhizobium leguminosarum bv. viciae]